MFRTLLFAGVGWVEVMEKAVWEAALGLRWYFLHADICWSRKSDLLKAAERGQGEIQE